MASSYRPVTAAEWIPGDYRLGASIREEATSIEEVATMVGATVHQFVERGLGPGRTFAVRSDTGTQAAFEQYARGGLGLLVAFEGGICSKAEIKSLLAAFGVHENQVYWYAPEARDA